MALFFLPNAAPLISGESLPGAKLTFYLTGTSTVASSYTDAGFTTPHPSPVVADATGVFPPIYLATTSDYRVVLTTAAGELLRDIDPFPAFISTEADAVDTYPVTEDEEDANVTPSTLAYPELDIRRYGAVGDYDTAEEEDGQVATLATDNLPALEDAFAVAMQKGGGVIRICGGGDYYISNSWDATGLSNLYVYVEPGTTLRTTKYTSLGTVITLGTDDQNSPETNVGVFGGGTIRAHQPNHATVPAHAINTAYVVGDYVLSTDTNGETRAYYCKVAGTTGGASPPDVVNGSDTDGTVQWQDADNDNLISISGVNVLVDGMDLPTASGKPITCQVPGWKNVQILNNRIGTTNDKAIEVKGQSGIAGQANFFGDGTSIVGNVITSAGREGIEVEQSSFGVNLNRNARVVGNIVRNAGVINDAAGIRINRCVNVEVRGNKVLDSGGNGYHIRLCEHVTGDLHSESADGVGVHLQDCSGWAFDSIYVKDSVGSAVHENDDNQGGYVGFLHIDSADADAWETTGRDGPPPVIASYLISAVGAEFVGELPTLTPNVRGAKQQAFVLNITNDGGTIKHNILSDIINASASQFADRITAASDTLTATPTGANASTAFAAGGKISSAATNEFIFNHANAANVNHGVPVAVICRNSSTVALTCGLIRRSLDVNGATLARWHLEFRNATSGAAYDLTSLGSGLSISAQIVMYLP